MVTNLRATEKGEPEGRAMLRRRDEISNTPFGVF
jgi:hypothetical protein